MGVEELSMNDLNLRFERPPQRKLSEHLKTQQQKRDYDEAMDFGGQECREAFLACRTADWKNAIPKANNAQCQIEAERIKDEQLQRTRKAVNQVRTEKLKQLITKEEEDFKTELQKAEKIHILRSRVKKSLFN